MRSIPDTPDPDRYRCAECDVVIATAADSDDLTESFVGESGGPVHRVVTVGGVEVHRCLSPYLMLSDYAFDSSDAGSAWECIATARAIVAEQRGCSPDDALRAMKARADDLGRPIGEFAAGVIDGQPLMNNEPHMA
jgi:hypothetical protein